MFKARWLCIYLRGHVERCAVWVNVDLYEFFKVIYIYIYIYFQYLLSLQWAQYCFSITPFKLIYMSYIWETIKGVSLSKKKREVVKLFRSKAQSISIHCAIVIGQFLHALLSMCFVKIIHFLQHLVFLTCRTRKTIRIEFVWEPVKITQQI